MGHAESTRLLGTDPSAGPLAQLVDCARRLPPGDIDLIHIRDWHDPDDPAQRDHLAQFGAHCIRGTSGARLVLGMDEHAAPNERIVDSLNLNDLEGTDLAAQLDEIRRAGGDGRLRVGVVGVWTEAKVSFLLYDLKTRLGIDDLATCSALTASASRAQHFNALSQLEKILGVRCFESLAEFVDWLQPGSELELPSHRSAFEPRFVVAHDGALDPVDGAIVAYLFRDSTEVELEPLAGGFSGSLVWRATSHDAMGHRQAPSVVKVGPNRAMAQERVAFERVEAVLGNNAPRVRGFVDLGDRAGLKYSYAAMGQGRVRTLRSMFAAGLPTGQLVAVVRAAFEEVLGPLYAAAQYERLPLLEHYGFSAALAPVVREAVASVAPGADREVLEFLDGWRLPNVVGFYEDFLPRRPPGENDHHYVSYVHGDLNAANILVDAHDNVWVIDFFHSAPGHVLKDLAKFENDLLYLLTPLADAGELAEALTLTRALRSVVDLRAPLQGPPDGVRSPHLVRAWQVLGALRGIGAQLCHDDRHPLQLQVALLRYAVHTLGFEESSLLQTAMGPRLGLLARRADRPDHRGGADLARRLGRHRAPLPGTPRHHGVPGPARSGTGPGRGCGSAAGRGSRPGVVPPDRHRARSGRALPISARGSKRPVSTTGACPSPTRAHPTSKTHGPWLTGAGRRRRGANGSWSHAWAGWDAVARSRPARW